MFKRASRIAADAALEYVDTDFRCAPGRRHQKGDSPWLGALSTLQRR